MIALLLKPSLIKLSRSIGLSFKLSPPKSTQLTACTTEHKFCHYFKNIISAVVSIWFFFSHSWDSWRPLLYCYYYMFVFVHYLKWYIVCIPSYFIFYFSAEQSLGKFKHRCVILLLRPPTPRYNKLYFLSALYCLLNKKNILKMLEC